MVTRITTSITTNIKQFKTRTWSHTTKVHIW